jgi:hypothetical protein
VARAPKEPAESRLQPEGLPHEFQGLTGMIREPTLPVDLSTTSTRNSLAFGAASIPGARTATLCRRRNAGRRQPRCRRPKHRRDLTDHVVSSPLSHILD